MSGFDVLADRYQSLYRRNPVQIRAAEELLANMEPASRVMDLGCGTGLPVGAMMIEAGHRWYGYDSSTRMLELARRNCPGATLTHRDLTDLDGPAEPGPVDVVIAHLSLLTLSRAGIRRVVGRIGDWLVPGGLFSVAMVDVDADLMPVRFLDRPLSISGWAGDGLADMVRSAGFDVVSQWIDTFRPAGRSPERQSFVLARTASDSDG